MSLMMDTTFGSSGRRRRRRRRRRRPVGTSFGDESIRKPFSLLRR